VPDEETIEHRLTVTSLFGLRTRQPLVRLEDGQYQIQMPPDEARRIAIMLLECAAAAEHDAFMFRFTAEKIVPAHESDEQRMGAGATILNEYRRWIQAEREG